MGAATSQCVHTCCSCCWSGGKSSKNRTSEVSTVHNDADTWFEQDKVPLLSATHDHVTINEGITVRKVMVMRSPRPAASVESQIQDVSPSPSRQRVDSGSPKRGLRQSRDQHVESPRQIRSDSSANSSNDDGSWELASPGANEKPSPTRSPRSQISRGDENEEHKSTTPRGTSRSPDRTQSEPRHHHSHRSGSALSRESTEGFNDDDVAESPRSPSSPGRQSSGSRSPKRKPRYGRKNYRADSSRKKSL